MFLMSHDQWGCHMINVGLSHDQCGVDHTIEFNSWNFYDFISHSPKHLQVQHQHNNLWEQTFYRNQCSQNKHVKKISTKPGKQFPQYPSYFRWFRQSNGVSFDTCNQSTCHQLGCIHQQLVGLVAFHAAEVSFSSKLLFTFLHVLQIEDFKGTFALGVWPDQLVNLTETSRINQNNLGDKNSDCEFQLMRWGSDHDGDGKVRTKPTTETQCPTLQQQVGPLCAQSYTK